MAPRVPQIRIHTGRLKNPGLAGNGAISVFTSLSKVTSGPTSLPAAAVLVAPGAPDGCSQGRARPQACVGAGTSRGPHPKLLTGQGNGVFGRSGVPQVHHLEHRAGRAATSQRQRRRAARAGSRRRGPHHKHRLPRHASHPIAYSMRFACAAPCVCVGIAHTYIALPILAAIQLAYSWHIQLAYSWHIAGIHSCQPLWKCAA